MANQPEHEEHQEHEPMGPREPNTIYVGKKPTMNYVLACLTQINNGSNTVTVKARGRAISRAVDVAQVLTKRFATAFEASTSALLISPLRSLDSQLPHSMPVLASK